MTDTILRRLYIALSIVSLAPIWSAHYLPTVDGPSHLYNAWILKKLFTSNSGVIAQWYVIGWRPHPNWISHAALALLMTIVPPLIAEKLLVSGIVLLFEYAMWRVAGPLAFMTFPFAYSLFLQMGFYNFCIGVALYFIVISVRDPRGIALLLILTYFAHPMPALLAAGSIAFLSIAEKRYRNLLALIPVLPLLAWFFAQQGATMAAPPRTASGNFSYIMRMWPILSFDHYQERLGMLLFWTVAALIVITFIQRRAKWTFVLLTVAMIVLYVRAPAASSGGTMIFERMALFVALSTLLWIAPNLPRPITVAFVVIFSAISLLYTGYLVRRYRGLSKRMTEFVVSASNIPRNTTILPLIKDVRAPGAIVPIWMHAIDYVALEKGGVDIANYEPVAGTFPIALRPGVPVPDVLMIETQPATVDLEPYSGSAIFMWRVKREVPEEFRGHVYGDAGAAGLPNK